MFSPSFVSMRSFFLTAPLLSLSLVAFASTPAAAVVVQVNGTDYDLTTYSTSPLSMPSLFDLPSMGGKMPWWGDSNLAATFAEQVFNALGEGSTPGSGPYFAYELNGDPFFDVTSWKQDLLNASIQTLEYTPQLTVANYAILSPAPAPGPLPLLGIASALAMSRRLRSRIRSR
jgi:hypothetical protein